MRFGVREICNVTFKALQNETVGTAEFKYGQPVLYIDTAKTSTMEGAATTVYATGGRGNARLLAWEGEKTLTFTVEDALISPVGLSVLAGAGLIPESDTTKVHVHKTEFCAVQNVTLPSGEDPGEATIELTKPSGGTLTVCDDAPIFVLGAKDGTVTGVRYIVKTIGVTESGVKKDNKIVITNQKGDNKLSVGDVVLVDCYVEKKLSTATEIQIDAENFGGYYYVEADTLFRNEATGKDMPAVLTFPKVKIQSNFTFSMASSGDPSTFTFTMDAMPAYTFFDKTRKVMCVMQVIDETYDSKTVHTVMEHKDNETNTSFKNDKDSAFEDSYTS